MNPLQFYFNVFENSDSIADITEFCESVTVELPELVSWDEEFKEIEKSKEVYGSIVYQKEVLSNIDLAKDLIKTEQKKANRIISSYVGQCKYQTN
jgi:hypothetical protein